jgi:arginase family enzyme
MSQIKMPEILVFDFDSTITSQSWVASVKPRIFDLKKLTEADLFCTASVSLVLEDLVSLPDLPSVSFFGSGNYQYVTYFRLKKMTEPFSLVLFDFHSDAINAPVLSCGSWVRRALQDLPLMKKLIVVGIGEDHCEDFKDFPEVAIFKNSQVNFWRDYSKLLEIVKGERIYISVDKDVLSPVYAETNWDQGTLSLLKLTEILALLKKNCQVTGADVSGELPEYQDEILAGNVKPNRLNEKANQAILEALSGPAAE